MLDKVAGGSNHAPHLIFELGDMRLEFVLTFNWNYAQIVFNPLIFYRVLYGIIASKNVEVSGLKIWVEAENVIINYSILGGALFVILSHFLNDLPWFSKNNELCDVILPYQF